MTKARWTSEGVEIGNNEAVRLGEAVKESASAASFRRSCIDRCCQGGANLVWVFASGVFTHMEAKEERTGRRADVSTFIFSI